MFQEKCDVFSSELSTASKVTRLVHIEKKREALKEVVLSSYQISKIRYTKISLMSISSTPYMLVYMSN